MFLANIYRLYGGCHQKFCESWQFDHPSCEIRWGVKGVTKVIGTWHEESKSPEKHEPMSPQKRAKDWKENTTDSGSEALDCSGSSIPVSGGKTGRRCGTCRANKEESLP